VFFSFGLVIKCCLH